MIIMGVAGNFGLGESMHLSPRRKHETTISKGAGAHTQNSFIGFVKISHVTLVMARSVDSMCFGGSGPTHF